MEHCNICGRKFKHDAEKVFLQKTNPYDSMYAGPPEQNLVHRYICWECDVELEIFMDEYCARHMLSNVSNALHELEY